MSPLLPKSWPGHEKRWPGKIQEGQAEDEMAHIHERGLEPSQFLVENIGLLPRGRAYDVAMGAGPNAIYLAKMGFEVEGVDISPQAVSTALESARKSRVNLRAQVADLEDNFYIEKGVYDVIICFNYLQRSLIPQMKDGLRKGGMVVYETFTVEQAQFGKPENPDYLLKPNELLYMFRDFRCLRYREGIIEARRAVASIIAEKV
ncbi:MAG: class I SAM-dependent methyltransferase [Desulfatiglandales bacterium]